MGTMKPLMSQLIVQKTSDAILLCKTSIAKPAQIKKLEELQTNNLKTICMIATVSSTEDLEGMLGTFQWRTQGSERARALISDSLVPRPLFPVFWVGNQNTAGKSGLGTRLNQ